MTDVRAEIPAKYKWDLTAIYPDMDAFNADYDRAKEMIAKFPAHKDTMLTSAEALYAMFCDMTELGRVLNLLYSYASLNSDVDTSDNSYVSLKGRVMNLDNDLSAAAFFVDPYLLRLDDETIEKWYEEFPKLKEYRRSIDASLRYRPHTLSDDQEKLMADLSGGFQNFLFN